MQETSQLIARILSPDTPAAEKPHAFGLLVRRFQDMAYGCAYAHLGDAHLAEDAAQDAFLAAWQCLPQLREPGAFPRWLRRLVLTQCRRRTRGKRVPTVPLEAAAHLPSPDDPQASALNNEQRAAVHLALQTLPEGERLATVLFYIGDYSRAEIAAFLDISELAVKKRLASARRRLHERMLPLMEDNLHEQRPSRDDAFAARIAAFTQGFADRVDQGTSLVRSLAQLAARQSDAGFRAAIEHVNKEVQEGQMLSQAMAQHPGFFDDYYCNAIRLGEITGTLEVQLQRLAAGEEIFDGDGSVRVRGADDALIIGFADNLLWQALHQNEASLRLSAGLNGVRLFFRHDGQWEEREKCLPKLLPVVWEHYRRRANIGDGPVPQEGRFSYADYSSKVYTVRITVWAGGDGEEMTLRMSSP